MVFCSNFREEVYVFLEILWREKTTWLSALHSDGLLNYIKQLWLTEKQKSVSNF